MPVSAWKTLEDRVRSIAAALWNRPAVARHVAGVDVDAVLELQPDYWICIEVTQKDTLAKLREDLAKFQSVRPALSQNAIGSKCYFVTEFEPPPAIKETAAASHVEAMSVEQLHRLFFDAPSYFQQRRTVPFGSAVDPDSGTADPIDYVPVKYTNITDNSHLTVQEIAKVLLAGKRIVLLGEFGTGKSRCTQELFKTLSHTWRTTWMTPLAIDLRHNWGLKRGPEILRRHFEDLGLSSLGDPAVKTYNAGGTILLLDGFDEIGSQSWDPAKLPQIRHLALEGVRDLLSKSSGGALVCGREHYFNSQQEMFSALGLSRDETLVIRCENDFTPEEMQAFLEELDPALALPEWLPRRPLICRILAQLEPEQLDEMFTEADGDIAFWGVLIDSICRREEQIRAILEAEKIKDLLRLLARKTRQKAANMGPLSVSEIYQAFEHVVGVPPGEESSVLLQRLPGLGRLAVETADRQFLDVYILDGLRGLDVAQIVAAQSQDCQYEKWLNPLLRLGQSVAAVQGRSFGATTEQFVRIAKQSAFGANSVLASDCIASVLRLDNAPSLVDFGGLKLADGHFSVLEMAEKAPANLHITGALIDELTLPRTDPPNLLIEDSVVGTVHNVSGAGALPVWVKADVQKYERITTTSQIKAANLTVGQRIFLAVIKKTFFQKGAGRKEEALLRGLGRLGQQADIDKVLNLLLSSKILTSFRGDEGLVYAPVREHTHRMRQLMLEMSRSKDPIWLSV